MKSLFFILSFLTISSVVHAEVRTYKRGNSSLKVTVVPGFAFVEPNEVAYVADLPMRFEGILKIKWPQYSTSEELHDITWLVGSTTGNCRFKAKVRVFWAGSNQVILNWYIPAYVSPDCERLGGWNSLSYHYDLAKVE